MNSIDACPEELVTSTLISREFIRFLVVGASNTLVAYFAYLALVLWLPYPVAWGVAYGFGIACGYVANSLFVFKKRLRGTSALAYCAVYLSQYLVSVLLLRIALHTLMLPHWLAALVVIVVTVPATFLLVRLALR